MATPMPSPVIDKVRPGSGWACVFSQIVGQGDPGIKAFVHRVGVKVWVIFGAGANPPQPQTIVEQMIANHTARAVYYMEIWEKDDTVLGTGYKNFAYIGVYVN